LIFINSHIVILIITMEVVAVAAAIQVPQEEEQLCYICYGSPDECGGFVDPHPCKCKGSIRVHQECFTSLLATTKSCLACKTVFKKLRKYKNGFELVQRMWAERAAGIKDEFTLKDGKKHGEYIAYHYATQIIKKTATYVEGKIHGSVREYEASGLQIRITDYVEDKIHGYITTYYPSGSIDTITSYIDNKKHGSCNKYYANGRPAKMTEYNNGIECGLWEFFYPNGQKSMAYRYNADGKIDGISQQWFADGKLQRMIQYNNGIKVNLEEYDRHGNINIPFA
jgi:antitoxin component YwqK of YwqJK toxin-antitoxin module